jgi:serine/threonine-protein kinase
MSWDLPATTSATWRPERIARGGMGEIYRAEDAELAGSVAVKVLGGLLRGRRGVRGRFTREAGARRGSRNAPNTVTIFDVGEHEAARTS